MKIRYDVILYRSLSEDLVEILIRSFQCVPCMKILQMPFRWMKALLGSSWEDLVSTDSRAYKIFSNSSRSFCDALVRFSYRGPGMKILVKVCYISLREDLLAKPST